MALARVHLRAHTDTSLEDAATHLVDAANEAGGKDNVTVILMRYSDKG